jgi:hypothetical protein
MPGIGVFLRALLDMTGSGRMAADTKQGVNFAAQRRP